MYFIYVYYYKILLEQIFSELFFCREPSLSKHESLFRVTVKSISIVWFSKLLRCNGISGSFPFFSDPSLPPIAIVSAFTPFSEGYNLETWKITLGFIGGYMRSAIKRDFLYFSNVGNRSHP